MPASPSSSIQQITLPSFAPWLRRRRGPAPAHPTTELGFGIIHRYCPPELVERAVVRGGRKERRLRMLPGWLVVYCVLLLCLFPDASYQEVLQRAALGAIRPGRWLVPGKSALIQARKRLGWQVMKDLFGELAGHLARSGCPGAFWRGWRLMAIDGSTMEVESTAANEEALGGPRGRLGMRYGRPQIRIAALVESGTHALLEVEMESFAISEIRMVGRLVRSLEPGMLVLADAVFFGVRLWNQFIAGQAHLLWRVSKGIGTRVEQPLPDGSYLTTMRSHHGRPEKARVRVVEYRLNGSPEVYRLFTDILDPSAAPAAELARLYHERWEIEGAVKEVKTYQRGTQRPLRSKSPELVRQEFWAHMILHGIVRKLAYQAAAKAQPGRDPDTMSFTVALQILRRSATSGTGAKAAAIHVSLQNGIAELSLPRHQVVRRFRQYPRICRHQRSRYPRVPRRRELPKTTYLEPPRITVVEASNPLK